MRRSIQFLLFIALIMTVVLLLPLHALHKQQAEEPDLKRRAVQLSGLQLTDLCLTTEARYTRHPALSDLHAPFQEHPLALEHFPSGSIILPLPHAGETP